MTADVSKTLAISSANADGEAAPVTKSRRSVWRVSLGGVLLFAAGAMVGFAPMRAWVFFRGVPKSVTVSAVILEADAREVAGIREAMKAHAENERTRNLDPLTILESRPGTKTLARPTLQATIGEPVRYFSGGEIVLSHIEGEAKTHPVGTEATFEPRVRSAGTFELSYRICQTRPADSAEAWTRKGLIDFDEESIDSTAVLRPDVWEAVQWDSGTSAKADPNRVRWIFLKVHPED